MTAIDAFIDNMYRKLTRDIIEYIVKRYIFLPNNIYAIRRQKIAKYLMHIQMLFISNIIYIDDNYCIYIHDHDIIIHNIREGTSNTYRHTLYGPLNNVSGITVIPQATTAQINSNLEQVQNTNLATYDNTSNIVIHTNNDDMENIIFYVLYSLDEGHSSQI
jgi:hypothetical protein